MKRFLLMTALCGVLSYALPIAQETDEISEADLKLAKKYMENYYSEKEPTPTFRSRSNNAFSAEKIRKMQQFFGLEVTGKLDSETLDEMKKPRCGVPDIGEFSTFPGSPTWGKKTLTYRILNYTPDMNQADVDNAVERAWKVWSDVTPLTFTRVYNGPADIDISFAAGSHGDYYPFDGMGGQLAHAYSPAYGGNVHFDEDENWARDLKGINLFIVAAHEFGHSLGLGHSDVFGALMFPQYQPFDPQNLRLDMDDIQGIQTLYGSPDSMDSENNDEDNGNSDYSEIPITPDNVPSTDMCDPQLTFDAATSLRGETIFFKDSFFWRKNPLANGIEKDPISAFWPSLSSGVDAAYENEDKDTVYLFKGHKYWATKGNIISPRFPKNIHHLGFPKTVKNIDAAVYDTHSKKTYFFSGNNYWRYDETKNSMEKGFPRKIADDFHGVGPKVDAALFHNGHFYLFSGSKQYEFDSQTKRFLGIKKSTSWFGC